MGNFTLPILDTFQLAFTRYIDVQNSGTVSFKGTKALEKINT
jgi:hypothetical protein